MITPAGIWIVGHVEPEYKPAMDACMSVFPGQMIYTGNMNRDKWLELGAPGQWITTPSGGLIWHCDLGDLWQLYFALREEFIVYPEGWAEKMAAKSEERKVRKAAEVIEHA